jgi:signal transduction histidine kinase/CheY-like chemotaxis protein
MWVGLMSGCLSFHLVLCELYARAKPAEADWRPWLLWFTFACGIEGATWCFGAIALTSGDSLEQELIVLLVSSAIASGAVSVFGTYLPAYAVFFFPAIGPHLVFAIVFPYPLHFLLAALILAYLIAMSAIAWSTNRQLVESLRLRFENLDLLEQVRIEKERAEEANVSKSRFLAAASHDLRQPLHALSLFVGALQSREMDEEAHDLADNIAASVGAMDMLFSSLLDISKLDAGVIEVRPRPFRLAPLLERICRDVRGEADEKGLTLDLHVGKTVRIRSDPVLAERILRNIISNAVRYTEKGRVLVVCRKTQTSSGKLLRIETWDTGPGIVASEQTRIFQEFYQLGNPERDRAKGLGLGLAIVQRMTALLGAPLSLKSRPGRGSVFKVAFPLVVDADEFGQEPLATERGSLRKGLILVVDDEVAIQEGMRHLLTNWGHEVIAAGSGAEMLERVATRADRPDLIICDYRLRSNENGIAVIRRLQMEYNEDIPAMLVTGDTAPDRLSEAQASGLLLLHKPVANSKLRAAIGNLMGARNPA